MGMLLSESVEAPPAKPVSGAEVVVIGAGFAGLAAAYELHHRGYRVTVVEAQRDFGGRVRSLYDVVPGKVVEGGGELIGSNHPTWNAYAARFRLAFSDVVEGPNAPVILKARKLTHARSHDLLKDMDRVLKELADLSDRIEDPFSPWTARDASTFDARPLHVWVKSLEASDLCKLAVELMLSTDNGVPANRQSFLGNLAMIRGGGGPSYWLETERYRCIGGNRSLAEKLIEPVRQSVHFQAAVREIEVSGEGVKVLTKDGQVFEARDAILAVPPSVWADIRFTPGLPRQLNLQMGANVKFLMSFKNEFWKKDRLSPNMTSDGAVELTWHSTEKQGGPGHAVVGFSGADAARKCASWRPTKRTENYIAQLRRVYKNVEPDLIDARFMNWPADPWVRASYAFPKPGEITKCGPFLQEGIGHLHFAGEHTCYAFIGYMEGALNSGVRAARKLARRDGMDS
jgi:monoamine oxidase